MVPSMEVSSHKLECLNRWIKLIIPSVSNLRDDELLPLKLVDFIRGSQLACTTSGSAVYDVSMSILSDFYMVDINELLKPTRDGDTYTVFGHCCLLLLILAMGLRLKCKMFMAAAFNLPSFMHSSVVELTQPLIDDSVLTLSSFAGLHVDSENLPLTPIRQLRLTRAPVTCPPRSRPPLLVSTRFDDENSLPGPINKYMSPIASNPLNIIGTRAPMEIRLSSTQPAGLDSDMFDMVDSPLHSLNTILDSPNWIPKSQYVAKLEEIRKLSAELAEVRHLYEVTSSDLDQLNVAYQNCELQRKEAEVRLRRQESELNDLRDELAQERESRARFEHTARNTERLRERLTRAREELKAQTRLRTENLQLQQEVSELRSKLKLSEEKCLRTGHLRITERQACMWKESLRVAEEKIMQLVLQRERDRATSEAEASASLHRLRRHHSQELLCSTSCPGTPIRLSSSQPVECRYLSPDSSQPELDLVNIPKKDSSDTDALNDGSKLRGSPKRATCSAENLASVVAVNSHIHELEIALTEAREDVKSAQAQCLRQKCRTIVAQVVSHRRLQRVGQLQAALETVLNNLELCEASSRTKFNSLDEQLLSVRNRIEAAEESLRAFQNRRERSDAVWMSRLVELQEQLEETKASEAHMRSDLTDRLQKSLDAQRVKDEEVKNLQLLLDTAGRSADEKLQDIERQASIRDHALRGELNKLTQTVQELMQDKKRLNEKLTQQLHANEAYRKATEEELDQLRNTVSTLSTSNTSALTEQAHEHRLVQERLNTELAQLKQINEDKSRYAARLKAQLDEAQTNASAQQRQLKDAITLAETRKTELAGVHADYSQLRIRSMELEEQYSAAQARVKQLESTVSELEARLAELETDKVRWENRCARLVTQNSELEVQAQQKVDRARELQSLLDISQQERSDLERRVTVLREQLRQTEADWMQSRDQLSQARAALAQSVQLQHETSLQLMRANFNYAQATERLSLLQTTEQQVALTARSTLALFPHTRSVSVSDRSAPGSDAPHDTSTVFDDPIPEHQLDANSEVHRQVSLSPIRSKEVSVDTIEIQSNYGSNRFASGAPLGQSHREEVAVQTCGSHVARRNALVSCSARPDSGCSHFKSALWPPYAESTAPVSPAGLRNKEVYSGASPQRHLRRFRRLILAPDEEQPPPFQSDLLHRPIPQDQVHENTSIVSASSPTKRNRTSHSPLERSASVVTQATRLAETCDIDATYDTSECSMSQGSTAPLSYIPETPLPWNATSTSSLRSFNAHDIAKFPVTMHLQSHKQKCQSASEVVAGQARESVDQQSRLNPSPSHSKKFSRLWKANKFRKRPKKSH